MALYLKIFVRPYSIIVQNFKFLSQSARFPQILKDSSPATTFGLLDMPHIQQNEVTHAVYGEG